MGIGFYSGLRTIRNLVSLFWASGQHVYSWSWGKQVMYGRYEFISLIYIIRIVSQFCSVIFVSYSA